MSETATSQLSSSRQNGQPANTVFFQTSLPSCALDGNRSSIKGNLGFQRLSKKKTHPVAHPKPPFPTLQCGKSARLAEQKLNRPPTPLCFVSQSARPIAPGVEKDLLSFQKNPPAGATLEKAPGGPSGHVVGQLRGLFSRLFENRRVRLPFSVPARTTRNFDCKWVSLRWCQHTAAMTERPRPADVQPPSALDVSWLEKMGANPGKAVRWTTQQQDSLRGRLRCMIPLPPRWFDFFFPLNVPLPTE